MKKILITRPETEIESLAVQLRKIGLEPINEPLLNIQPLYSNKKILEIALQKSPQAILVTSKQAITILADWDMPISHPFFVVGKATADYAAKLHFQCVAYCETASELPAFLERHYKGGHLLYIRGEDISIDLSAPLEQKGFSVDSVIVYRAIPKAALSKNIIEEITHHQIAGVLFFSQRTAEAYVYLAQLSGLTAAHNSMYALCISEAVAAKVAILPWQAVASAKAPDMEHIIIAAAQLFKQN